MTRKRRRLILLLTCGVGLGGAAALTLSAFSDNLVFFVSPSDLAKNNPGVRSVRLGGLVAAGSLERSSGGQPKARFKVTDGAASVEVIYQGILPDLFREGQGVVALGNMQADGVFRAAEVLAKHDESYMPKEVADALKRSGRWNPSAGPPPSASTWNIPAGSTRIGNTPIGNSGVGDAASSKAPREKATIETLPAGNPTAKTMPADNNSSGG